MNEAIGTSSDSTDADLGSASHVAVSRTSASTLRIASASASRRTWRGAQKSRSSRDSGSSLGRFLPLSSFAAAGELS